MDKHQKFSTPYSPFLSSFSEQISQKQSSHSLFPQHKYINFILIQGKQG